MFQPNKSNLKAMAVWRWLVLLLAAWPGPRPIVHSHQQLVERAASSTIYGSHLAVFHPAESKQLPPWQLHLHWGYGECVGANATLIALDVMASAIDSHNSDCSADQLALDSCCRPHDACWSLTGDQYSARPAWLTIDKLSATPPGRLWLQICNAWTC